MAARSCTRSPWSSWSRTACTPTAKLRNFEDLADHLPADGSPWGPPDGSARWVLTNGPDVAGLKARLHAAHPLPGEPPAGAVAVALAAGLHASRVDGSDLEYNSEHPWLPDLLVCRRELAGALLSHLERVGGQA